MNAEIKQCLVKLFNINKQMLHSDLITVGCRRIILNTNTWYLVLRLLWYFFMTSSVPSVKHEWLFPPQHNTLQQPSRNVDILCVDLYQ